MDKKFECLIHARASSLDELPSPFLNRFEKYRLSIKDVLAASWARFPGMNTVMRQSRRQTEKIIQQFGQTNGRFGWLFQSRTADSVFLTMLPPWSNAVDEIPLFKPATTDFTEMVSLFVTSYTSMREVHAQAQYAIGVARKILSKHECNCLEECLNGSVDPQDIAFAFNKVLNSDSSETLPAILTTVIQMTVSRCALSTLIQLAPPELVYVRRYGNNLPRSSTSNTKSHCWAPIGRMFLPPELVAEYFGLEHFSLQRLIKNRADGDLMIVHTRSTQEIHRLPSLPADRCATTKNGFCDIDVIMELVHENPDEIVIEHLERLRSETALRNSLTNWTHHRTRHTFVLLVDMNKEKAVKGVNFVRSLAEQIVSSTKKSFVLVLHYSPSSAIDARLYPALFIGGWQQFFFGHNRNV